MLKILLAFFCIILIIILHEGGHFAACMLCGIKVKEFSVGFGHLLYQKEYNGMKWSFRLCPLGGFCLMDDEELENAPGPKKICIYSAGIVVNLFTAFVLFTIAKGDPLKAAYALGVCFIFIMQGIIDFFTANIAPGNVLGLIGTSKVLGDMMTDMSMVCICTGVLSAIIGIGNLLPIPGLDGGKIMGALFEWISGRKISQKVHLAVNLFISTFISVTVIIAIIADIRYIWSL